MGLLTAQHKIPRGTNVKLPFYVPRILDLAVCHSNGCD